MSWQRVAINWNLRWIEKPYLARVQEPEEIRRRFERTARLMFHPPSGTRYIDRTIGPCPALAIGDDATKPLLLYFHGGGYVFGSPRTHAAMLATLAKRSGARAVLPRYRLAPEQPFPAAIEDACSVYEALLDAGDRPDRIALGGDSAGGGLALSLLGEVLRRNLPAPICLFAFSPLTDLTFSGPSLVANATTEVLLPAQRAADMASFYLGDHPADDPRASPLFADFAGAPPIWMAVGDTEILRDDTRRLASRLKSEGVSVTVEEAADLPHVWPIFHNSMPEARATLRSLGSWLTQQFSTSGDS